MADFEGMVEDIVYRNEQNGFTVLSVKLEDGKELSAVGTLPFLAVGERAVFHGAMVEHREYGAQIRVDSYETLLPEKVGDIEKYLASGLIKGVGPATARLIVGRFGDKTLDVLESRPDRLTEVPGIGPKRAALIGESFAANVGARQTMMFLQGLGLTPAMAGKVSSKFGDMAKAVVRANPYRLADEVEGIGFRTADQIALNLGFSRDSAFRLKSGVRYVLTEAVAGEGHVYLPYEELLRESRKILAAGEEAVTNAIAELIVEGQLTREEIDGVTVLYLPRLYQAEKETALRLRRLLSAGKKAGMNPQAAEKRMARYERETGVELGAKQREAVLAAALGGVTVITGGPGTGKTTSIRCLIDLLEETGKIELCAPTGRAAKRMAEATGRTARTIHRMLEYAGEDEGFGRDADHPLDANSVIVDEMSMVDIFLMRALLRAVKPGARLVLVGDADQLPSVGAGNVLRDLIESGAIPVVQLTEIFRQAAESNIIMNAHRINHGEYPVILNRDTDFFLERKNSTKEVAQSVVALTQSRLPRYLGVDGIRDIQVMAPMKKGDAGVYELNKLLQEKLNPPAAGKAELRRNDGLFRVGDKVMQVKNNYDLEWTRAGEEGAGVFNGDIGYVTQINREEGGLTVDFDDGRQAEYDAGCLEELELAYCMSVHKSQGSEFPAVVLPLFAGPPMLMTRNLLYTAVTRARRLVVIVGREDCVKRMVDNNHIHRRYSGLEKRLREG